MNEFNPHSANQRVLASMAERIDTYKAGHIHFAQLVSELNAGSNCLIGMAKEWREQFEKEWFSLEQANALALDEDKVQLLGADREFVAKALTALVELINSARTQQSEE